MPDSGTRLMASWLSANSAFPNTAGWHLSAMQAQPAARHLEGLCFQVPIPRHGCLHSRAQGRNAPFIERSNFSVSLEFLCNFFDALQAMNKHSLLFLPPAPVKPQKPNQIKSLSPGVWGPETLAWPGGGTLVQGVRRHGTVGFGGSCLCIDRGDPRQHRGRLSRYGFPW